MTTTNGGPAPIANQQPQLKVVAQYIRDFSFENPNAPQSLTTIGTQLNASLMFRFDLEFAGVFRVQNVPPENLNAIVLIECPRLLFPFAREIVATTVRNGGFPPLLLDPVDFVGLYRQKMSEMQPAGAVAPPS
jgi:preprotein translocase subunit SecB